MKNANPQSGNPAGFRPRQWSAGAGMCLASYYNLPPEHQPFSVKVGNKRIIRESPEAWLERMAKSQEAA